MATEHVSAGEPVHLLTWGQQQTRALVKTPAFEALRVVLQAGKSIPPHQVEGPITVQCLSGQVELSFSETKQRLQAGDWLYLDGGTQHAVSALEDSQLLVTILFRPAD